MPITVTTLRVTPNSVLYQIDDAGTQAAWLSSATKLADPVTLPAGNGQKVGWHPDGSDLAVAHFSSPFVTAYNLDAGVLTKVANPGTLPAGTGLDVKWRPQGDVVIVGHDASPRVTAYAWANREFGAKFTDPASLPSGDTWGVAWSPDGSLVGAAHEPVGFSVWHWDNGFGAKFTNVDPLLGTQIGRTLAFHPTLPLVAVAFALDLTHSRGFGVWPYDVETSQLGERVLDVRTNLNCDSLTWSPDGSLLFVNGVDFGNPQTGPFVYPFTNGVPAGTRWAEPTPLPPATQHELAVTDDGKFLVVTYFGGDLYNVYAVDAEAEILTLVDTVASPPTGTVGIGAGWSKLGRYLALSTQGTGASPFLFVYDSGGLVDETAARDVLTDLAQAGDGPGGSSLRDALNPAAGFADQAAARAAFLAEADAFLHQRLGGGNVLVDQNVSAPATAGNFRLELVTAKGNPDATGTYFVRVVKRHSLTE